LPFPKPSLKSQSHFPRSFLFHHLLLTFGFTWKKNAARVLCVRKASRDMSSLSATSRVSLLVNKLSPSRNAVRSKMTSPSGHRRCFLSRSETFRSNDGWSLFLPVSNGVEQRAAAHVLYGRFFLNRLCGHLLKG